METQEAIQARRRALAHKMKRSGCRCMRILYFVSSFYIFSVPLIYSLVILTSEGLERILSLVVLTLFYAVWSPVLFSAACRLKATAAGIISDWEAFNQGIDPNQQACN